MRGQTLTATERAAVEEWLRSEEGRQRVGLGDAWREAEAALPEGWKPYLSVWYDPRDPGWRAAASRGGPTRPIPVLGKGATPAEALRVLAAQLRATTK